MRLASARDLQAELLCQLRLRRAAGEEKQRASRALPSTISGAQLGRAGHPNADWGLALGIRRRGAGYALAIRVQDAALLRSPVLDGIVAQAHGEVDVRFIGRVRPLSSHGETWRRERLRPLMIGTSTGHVDVPVGSIGAFVEAGGISCLLSNNHVLAKENRAAFGDPVLQPAVADGGREPEDVVATLQRAVPLRWDQPNYVDAAIAALSHAVEFDPTTLRGLGGHSDARLSGTLPCEDGTLVYKAGRSTGVTRGVITTCELSDLSVHFDAGHAIFDHQIEIEPVDGNSFAEGGDSGSIVVDANGMAIGLIFARDSTSPGLTYANPIGRVLSELDATLLF